MRPTLVSAILILAAALPPGCSPTVVPPSHDAQLEVRVVRGPLQPVEREGESNVAVVARALVSIRALADGGVRRVETDSAGVARIALRPGDYRLEVTRCPAGTLFTKSQDVTVTQGASGSATLVCDTGIR